MKKVDVILGLQWGDEGKGKVVDVLTPSYQVVARFQGGPNAGHTLEFNGEKYVLRSIPSGIFQGGKTNIIGNGVVLDPVLFREEAEGLAASGHDLRAQLCISKKAHLILPTHRALDAAYEAAKGSAKIGTTGKGIGPTYTDKISRTGIRVGDLLHPDFRAIYDRAKARHEAVLRSLDYACDLSELEARWFEAAEYLKQFRLIDSEYEINNALAEDRSVLAEGAQGTLLDVDFGSYPFVTSSNTVCAGACTGLGVAPNRIGEVHKMDDLKNLKGGMDSREHLADYVTKAMKNYNVVYTDNSEELYRKLFTGEIDYVFTSYYYGIVQTSRLGIRRQVSFSKQSLWDMPLFIGVSKTAHYRKSLFSTLSKMLQNPKYKEDLQKHLIETIQNVERKNIGVVPPAFIKK